MNATTPEPSQAKDPCLMPQTLPPAISQSLIPESFAWPSPPVFEQIDQERLYRKQRLAAALRLFAHYGFDYGLAGHITVRDPELLDHFWVNPLAVYFGHIHVCDLLLVNHRGEIVQGNRPVNQAAFAIHSQLHAARPDIIAAAHSHSPYGKVWSTTGRLLDPLTQDACAFFEDHSIFDDYTGIVLDTSEGQRIAQALADHKAIILRNHGLLTVGHSVDEAAWWFITMEDACRTQILAESLGKPIEIDPNTARKTGGSSQGGWYSFQPLYDKIVREQPDLLE
ncbi:MAG: class II aldolase/adducin family protein [Cyanobacteriota bacterium]|nr:class II aldolase/adducin family protein [Cyanobacteriota bacterium]